MPKLVIFAGANGSGKTTNTRELVKAGFDVIDPDRIARNLNPNHPESAGVSAGKIALNRAKENIKQGISFTIETTLSSKRTYQSLIELAHNNNFEISLIYVSTENPLININRVADRVLKGGHDIPISDIIRRYKRSLQNYPEFFDKVDNNLVIDNTLENVKQIEIHGEQIIYACPQEQLPNWLKNTLGKDRIERIYHQYNQS